MIYREAGQFRTSYAADQALFPIRQDRLVVWAIVVFAFLVVPFLASEYLLRAILIPFVILAIAAIGLNILVGYCGQISLGSAAFMAVGAYASYDISIYFPGLNLIVVFVLGGVCAAAAGVVFGLPSLRIKGYYLAVATLAAQFFFDWLFIRIRPLRAKLSAFAVSSFVIGVTGALWAFVHLGSWEPLAFSIDRSFELLFMVVIGGIGSILGSFLGAAFITMLPIFLNQLPGVLGIPLSTAMISHLEFMSFGALIVFFLIVEPQGLARLWSIFREKLRLWPFPH